MRARSTDFSLARPVIDSIFIAVRASKTQLVRNTCNALTIILYFSLHLLSLTGEGPLINNLRIGLKYLNGRFYSTSFNNITGHNFLGT